MRLYRCTKQALGICLLIVWTWATLLPTLPALADAQEFSSSPSSAEIVSQERNWDEVNRQIVASLQVPYENTEDFVVSELNHWADSLIDRVDKPFLDWYFNFWHQKSAEFVTPLTWATYKLDSKFKILRTDDEKDLNANQLIRKHVEGKFSRKFADMVLNEEAQKDLKNIAYRALKVYESGITLRLEAIRINYQIPELDWERHLNDISMVILNTGTQTYDFQKLASNLTTDAIAITSVAATSKLVSSLAIKSVSKMAAKGGVALAAKWGATLLDPTLGIGLIIWDIWSYKAEVGKNRPVLKKKLEEYITELKNAQIENIDGDGIMDAIASVQNDLIRDPDLLSNLL